MMTLLLLFSSLFLVLSYKFATAYGDFTLMSKKQPKREEIEDKPVLAVMYLVQYMPTIGYWLMDKVGKNRVEVAARKGNTCSLSLLLGKKAA